MCDVLSNISDEKIKTTRDQVTTQSNKVLWLLLLNMKCHYIYEFCYLIDVLVKESNM